MSIQHLPEVLASAITQDKEIKRIQIGNKEVKLFMDSVENLKKCTKKLPQILSKNATVGEYNI